MRFSSSRRGRQWRPAFHGFTPDEKRRAIAKLRAGEEPVFQKQLPETMAEPAARTGPPGVSSGLSMRRFPSSTLDEVRNICKHYEEKCGGKYAATTPAARYLFQMSREILVQLAALETWMKERTAVADSVADEYKQWQEHFSPASKQQLLVGLPNAALATPSDIAAYIAQLQDLLQQTREREEKVAVDADEQVDQLRKAIANNRAVARVQAEEDRKRHAAEIAAMKTQMEDAMQKLSGQYQDVIASVQSQAKATIGELEAELAARDDVFDRRSSEREQEASKAMARMKRDLERRSKDELARSKSEADETIFQQQRKLDMLQAVLQQTKARMHASALQASAMSKGKPASVSGVERTLSSVEALAKQAEELRRCRAELEEQKRLNEALHRRNQELQEVTNFVQEGRELIAKTEGDIAAMDADLGALADKEVFAHSQVQQRMVPKYWNQTNVGRSVGSSPAETAAQIRDYDLNPKIHREAEPWSRAKPIPKDTDASLLSKPTTAEGLREKEAKIHQYCEAHRQARAAGTPIRVVDDVAASLGQAKPPKRVHFGDPAPTTQTLEAPSERGSEARGGPVGLAATLAARPRGADLPLQPEQEGSIVPEQVKAVDEQDDKLAEDLAATTAPTVPESTLAATLKRPMRLGAEFQLPLSATLGTRKPRPSPRPSEEAIFEYVFRGKTSSERGGPGGVRRSPII